jgi:hypothetical protein
MTITVDDVRQFLLDRGPEDNFLLDNVEFDNTTILSGLRWVADLYNTQTPFVDDGYDIDTFPYRAEAIMGAAAYCLRSMAMNMARNESQAQTQGGTLLRDKGKAVIYLNLASEISNEMKSRIAQIKISKNVEACYRIV